MSLQMICGATGGDLHREAFNQQEQIVFAFLIASGALLWGQVIGTFVSVIANADPDTTWFRSTLDSLNRFLHLHNMPHDNPQLCIQVREYFQLSMHLHRERANASLYELMSPKLQGTIVRQIPMHSKWMSALESILNKGRTGLFRSGDAIRIEPPDAARGGRNLITHVPTGMQVERQDFNAFDSCA